MKKIISLALSLSMLACMASTAFAATDHVVGTRGVHQDGTAADSIGDGVWPFSTNGLDTTYELAISVVTGENMHKYAVDITYADMSMSIAGGNMVWDVNKLEYVPNGEGVALGNNEFDVTVTNYSDLPVYVEAVVTDNFDGQEERADDGVTIATSLTEKTKIESAIGTTNGKPCEFNVTVSAENEEKWQEAVNFYMTKLQNAGSVEVGSVQVTISKE